MKNLLAGEQQAAVTVAVEALMDNKPEAENFAVLDPKVRAGVPHARALPVGGLHHHDLLCGRSSQRRWASHLALFCAYPIFDRHKDAIDVMCQSHLQSGAVWSCAHVACVLTLPVY